MCKGMEQHFLSPLEHSSQFSSSLLYGNCINHTLPLGQKKWRHIFAIGFGIPNRKRTFAFTYVATNGHTFHPYSQGQSVFLFFFLQHHYLLTYEYTHSAVQCGIVPVKSHFLFILRENTLLSFDSETSLLFCYFIMKPNQI